jgi:predicted RNA-binding Zn-ribbon protein involved in translation (DUF1610 family)
MNDHGYQVHCVGCNRVTSKKYAREHAGQCKTCVWSWPVTRYFQCPDCGEMNLTAYQKAHRYHCDNCTREADPEGYIREVRGLNDYTYD